MEELKYPIGRFSYPEHFSQSEVDQWIEDIATAPAAYRKIASTLSEREIETTYRPGGWTARQVIHHVADSHLQAYARFKLVLTEDSPIIKPYHEDRWAQLADTSETPIDVSLTLLEALHERWVRLLRHMSPEEFNLHYIHPEYGKKYALGAVCKLYAWHGKHHLAHLNLIKKQASS